MYRALWRTHVARALEPFIMEIRPCTEVYATGWRLTSFVCVCVRFFSSIHQFKRQSSTWALEHLSTWSTINPSEWGKICSIIIMRHTVCFLYDLLYFNRWRMRGEECKICPRGILFTSWTRKHGEQAIDACIVNRLLVRSKHSHCFVETHCDVNAECWWYRWDRSRSDVSKFCFLHANRSHRWEIYRSISCIRSHAITLAISFTRSDRLSNANAILR